MRITVTVTLTSQGDIAERRERIMSWVGACWTPLFVTNPVAGLSGAHQLGYDVQTRRVHHCSIRCSLRPKTSQSPLYHGRCSPSQTNASKAAPLCRYLVELEPYSPGLPNATGYAGTQPMITTMSRNYPLALGVIESGSQLIKEGCQRIR
jgi:hypothetical protein